MQVAYYIHQNDYVRARAIQLATMGGAAVGLAIATPILTALAVIIVLFATRCSVRLTGYFRQCQQEAGRLSGKDRDQYYCAIAKRRHRISFILIATTSVLSGIVTFLCISGAFALGTHLIG